MRAGLVVALTSAPLLAASSAFATSFQGEDAGPRLSVLQTIGIFAGIPLALFLLITFLVCLPGWMRGDRNRAEIGWDRKSGAPSSADTAGESEKAAAEKAGASAGGTGGASGSW